MNFAELNTTLEDTKLIVNIAKKAVKLANEFETKINYQTLVMDLEVVHNNIPLNLNNLLIADSENFLHDIYGIMGNIDRETGELKNGFAPRFSV